MMWAKHFLPFKLLFERCKENLGVKEGRVILVYNMYVNFDVIVNSISMPQKGDNKNIHGTFKIVKSEMFGLCPNFSHGK